MTSQKKSWRSGGNHPSRKELNLNICELHHTDVGREVKIKRNFLSISPHSKFAQGRILKVSGDLRFVKFKGRKTPMWLNALLLE
ncbi:MAG: hypothetical protein ACK5KM_05635 [Hyphomicrobiaceae bacterium]